MGSGCWMAESGQQIPEEVHENKDKRNDGHNEETDRTITAEKWKLENS